MSLQVKVFPVFVFKHRHKCIITVKDRRKEVVMTVFGIFIGPGNNAKTERGSKIKKEIR